MGKFNPDIVDKTNQHQRVHKMLHMEEKTSIILSHRREGMSIREIARRNGMSRKTVRKYLREFEKETGPAPTSGEVDDYLLTKPKYDSSGRVRRVVTEEVRRRIDGFIARNRENAAAGLHKQQMRKLDMWRRLQDDGIRIAYSTVCQYVRALEAMPPQTDRPAKAYIRQSYEPGFRCEFDWGVVTLWLDGVRTRLHMAVFTLDHSNMRKAYLFSREDTLALMEAHRNCFRELGGTPRVMAYDNMRTAVKKFLGRDREHTDALLRMEVHYCFTPHFCNPRSGWEKGKVERSVEYIRRRAFSFDVRFDSLEAAQAHLSAVCDRINAEASNMSADEKRSRTQADIAALRPLDHGDIGCFEQRLYRVGKYSTITVEGVHYSVPDRLVGSQVAVKLYSERIVVMSGRDRGAAHARSRRSGDWVIDLMHYLGTFLRKPAALGRSVALRQVHPSVAALYREHFRESPRGFIELLVYARDNNLAYTDIVRAAASLEARGLRRISAEQIQAQMISAQGGSPAVYDVPAADVPDTLQTEIESSASHTLDMLSSFMEASRAMQAN